MSAWTPATSPSTCFISLPAGLNLRVLCQNRETENPLTELYQKHEGETLCFGGWSLSKIFDGIFIRGMSWLCSHGECGSRWVVTSEHRALTQSSKLKAEEGNKSTMSPGSALFWGSPTKIDYRKRWYPYSNHSTGGPSQ